MRVNWAVVPDWVRWVARDTNGERYGFFHEPRPSKDKTYWVNSVKFSATVYLPSWVIKDSEPTFAKWERPKAVGIGGEND